SDLKKLIIGIIVFKIENVLNIRTPETVNTLSIVANNTQVFIKRSQLFYNKVLAEISILILIYQQVLKLMLVFVTHIRKITQQYIGFVKQIAKLHCARFEKTQIVFIINLYCFRPPAHFIVAHYFGIFPVRFRRNEIVFGFGNTALNEAYFVEFIVKRHFFNDTFE